MNQVVHLPSDVVFRSRRPISSASIYEACLVTADGLTRNQAMKEMTMDGGVPELKLFGNDERTATLQKHRKFLKSHTNALAPE